MYESRTNYHTTDQSVFFFKGYGDHRDLHSFPTRRSSDLFSLHSLLLHLGTFWPRFAIRRIFRFRCTPVRANTTAFSRSEEHTSELQSHLNLVCRLLLQKKKKTVVSS